MNNIIWGYIITFGWVFLILIVANVLKKTVSLSDENSRKIVHVTVSFAWVWMYIFFGISWHLLVPPLAFVVLNYISYKKDIFAVMERDQKDSASLGTVYYPISMVVLSLLSLADERFIIPYGIGMFCMAFGDGFAPIFGRIRTGNRYFCHGSRSLWGCCSVLIACLLVVVIMSSIFELPYTLFDKLLLAVCGMIMEFIGLKGFDNLTLPLGMGLLSWVLLVL